MPQPKITVIIPTRERCDVLESSIRTVTSQDYENLEIIVSDNCSVDDTQGVVERANDQRIRYLNTGKRLSMSHNWEFALSHVSDGWVTFMGDDDGLMPLSLSKVARIIEETKSKAIRSNVCTYDWPAVSGNDCGQLIVPLTSGIEARSCSHWLEKVMSGQAKYTQLPMIYNGGFIHISVLDEIRKKMGAYFSSAIPDVYSAIAISRLMDSYIYTREPLAINGTSKHSNGHSFFAKSKQRNEEPRIRFANEGNIPYHASIPLCADGSYPLSLQVCVYEAYLQSERLGNDIAFVNQTQQLQVILAMSGKHRQSIADWGKIFANMHKIDYQRIKDSTPLKTRYLSSSEMARKMLNAANCIIAESLPIMNVHEASIAAAVLRCSRGRSDTLRYMTKRLFNRPS